MVLLGCFRPGEDISAGGGPGAGGWRRFFPAWGSAACWRAPFLFSLGASWGPGGCGAGWWCGAARRGTAFLLAVLYWRLYWAAAGERSWSWRDGQVAGGSWGLVFCGPAAWNTSGGGPGSAPCCWSARIAGGSLVVVAGGQGVFWAPRAD
ncbi:hypothetical protein NDU88_006389 [Pleurodeles waltl]|uniref:Uncharacterized protein n=1 Tax=Pleurodeles waltl TaxID=8319 RepID=A0AAV7QNF3_PLEWA|nr:hypothetical protein NDU88_006389 [Pleurodeles waltl]